MKEKNEEAIYKMPKFVQFVRNLAEYFSRQSNYCRVRGTEV
jgi:hypothetical protein